MMKSPKPFSVPAVAATLTIALCATGCMPFTKVQGGDKSEAKISGSWSVMFMGKEKIEGITPLPTIVFDTTNKSVSGFDGCNNFRGTYAFVDGRLKAKTVGTRMACRSDTARKVSEQMADLLSNGAEMVEVSLARGHALVMKNASSELRFGPTDVLTKSEERK